MNEAELESLSGTAVPEEAPKAEDAEIAAELAAPPAEPAAAPVTAEAATAAETPAVEQRAEPRPEPTKQTVPLAVLMEERNERKQLKAKLEEAEKKIAAAEKIEAEIRAAREKPKVSFEDAPLEVIRDELGNVRKTVEEDRAARAKAEEEVKARASQEEGMRKFVNALRTDEAGFVEKNQDYYDALKFSREKNAQILSVYGYDEAQIKQMIDQSELAQANAAMQRGLSPSQVAYDIARNMGYTPKQAAAAAAAATPAKDPAAEIADIKKKQAAGGLPSNTPPNVADLADLPDSEFDAIFSEMFGKKTG